MIYDVRLVVLVCPEYINCAVNPHGKLINEVLFFLSKLVVFIKMNDVLRFIFTENQFFSIDIFQKNLGQDKYAVVQLGIVKITYVIQNHVALYIFQSINAVENVFYVCRKILMSFYDDFHESSYISITLTFRPKFSLFDISCILASLASVENFVRTRYPSFMLLWDCP